MNEPKQIMERILRTFNVHDAAAFARLYTEDATYVLPGQAAPLKGRQAIQESYEVFFRAFPDLQLEVTSTAWSANHLFCEFTMQGTHTGPLATPQGDVPGTGRQMELKVACVLDLTPDGLIAEDRSYYDSAVMMNQLALA